MVEPAISATQIKGMQDLHAYFVQRGFKNGKMVIVPLEIPYINLPEKHPAWVSRAVPQRDFQLPPDVSPLPMPPLVLPSEESNPVLVVGFN